MRRPVTGSGKTVAKPIIPLAILQVIAVGLLLISLQQPWAPQYGTENPFGPYQGAGAQSVLVSLSVMVAVAGVALGAFVKKLREELQRWLWATQLPIMLMVAWVLLEGWLFGVRDFGSGTMLALGGAALATQAMPKFPVKAVRLSVWGLLALVVALAMPIHEILLNRQLGYGFSSYWHGLALTTGFFALCLYLAWSLLVPILQAQSTFAMRVFRVGKWLPKASLEQAVARACTVVGLSAVLIVEAVWRGSARIAGWTTWNDIPGLAGAVLPLVGVGCLAFACENWRKCAPALLRRGVHQATLGTVTAVCGFLAVTQLLSIVVVISIRASFAVAMPRIVALVAFSAIVAVCWLDHFGIVSLDEAWGILTDWCVAKFSADTVPAGTLEEWVNAEVTGSSRAAGEAWSGAHRWVGPRLRSGATMVPDGAMAVPDGEFVALDDEAGLRNAVRNETENLNLAVVAATANGASSYAHGTEATTHLPVANRQADFGLVGETNPAVTDSGRLMVPLARPKWTPQQAMDPATHNELLARIAVEAPHLRPQVARNPNASPDLLNWLAGLNDPDVNLALASLGATAGQ